jgi:phage anti-repressor protein
MSDFSLSHAQQLLQSTELFPVPLEDAWQWLGYSRKDSAVDTLKSYFEENTDYVFRLQPESDNHAGLSAQEKAAASRRQYISLTVDCFKEMGMLAKTEKGRQIRKYFIECERVAKQMPALSPELLQFMQTTQQQLSTLTVNQDRLNQLEQLTQQYDRAAEVQPGCADIIADQLENQINDQVMTAIDFCLAYGIDISYSRRIAHWAGGFQRGGKNIAWSPKQKGTGRNLIELRYLKRAAKIVLKLE